MKKTLFLAAVLAFTVSNRTYAWEGGNEGSITTTWAGVTINYGYYVDQTKTAGHPAITNTNQQAVGITPEQKSTTAELSAVNLKNGADVYFITNQWDDYVRSFAGVTIDTLKFGDGSGSGSLNVLVYTGKEASSMTVNVKSVAGSLSEVNNAGVLTIGTAESTTTLSGSISNTGTMTLNGTFTLAENAKFSAVYMDADGATIAGKGIAAKSADLVIRNSGTLNKDAATITGISAMGDNYVVTGSEKTIAGSTYVVVNGATATEADMSGATNLILDGGSATIASGGKTAFVTGDVTILAGSKLTLTHNDALSWDTPAVDTITLEGSGSAAATLTNNASQTLDTKLILGGHSVVNGTGVLQAWNNGKITATGQDNTISSRLMLRKNLTVDVTNAGDTLVVSGLLNTSNWNMSGDWSTSLSKTGDGALTLSGGIEVNEDISAVITGDSHTTIEFGAAGNNTKAVKVKTGLTLTFNGSYIKDLRFDATTGYAGKVVLNGVTGYLNNGNSEVVKEHTIANAIELGEGGFTIDNGYSEHTYTFTGAITGSGDITRTANVMRDQTYVFENVANWSGSFVNSCSDKETNLTFGSSSQAGVQNHSSGTMVVTMNGTSYSGDVKAKANSKMSLTYTGADDDVTVSGDINNAVDATAGTINVTVNNADHTTTFSGTVHANTLTVSDNSLVNINGEATITALSGTGALNLSHDLTVTGNTATIGSLTLSNGADITVNNHDGSLTTNALTVSGADSAVNANLIVSANGTMDFSAGHALTMGCSVKIGSNVTVVIDESIIEGIVNRGETVAIIDGVDEITSLGSWNFVSLNSDGTYKDLSYANLRLEDAGNGTIVVAPEPATATLSLLALAALAARRKRH